MQFLNAVVVYSNCLFYFVCLSYSQEPEASIKILNADISDTTNSGNDKHTILKYTDDPDVWADVSDFIQDFDLSLLKLCVTGVFVIYKFPYYEARDETGVRLVNGIDKCIEIDDVWSVQMVSSFQSVYAHILTTFKEPYFQGRGFPVGRSVSRFSANFGDNVESLIISGSTPWTIVSFKGLTYCLTPTFDKATISFPICVFTTMNDTVIGKDTFWESIKPGCTSKSKVVKVNSCFSFSEAAKVVESPKGPRLEDVVNEAKRVILPAITECNKNEDFLTILDLRINNDFSSPLQMRFPKNKNDAWRTTLIDTVFDITIHSFPMVDPNLQRMLNEMFVYVIEKDVWSKGSGRPKEHTEDPEISSIASELEVCLELLSTNDNIHQVIDMVKEYLDFVESMPLIDTSERSEYIKGVLMEDFKRNITFDFMMEMIWLASNQVASACHIASGEGSNFWIDFYPIFKDMYLTPMIKFWSNPSNFERYYPHFFGGMQFNVQYEYMALCSSYYRTMSHLDIYSRPSELSLKKQ